MKSTYDKHARAYWNEVMLKMEPIQHEAHPYRDNKTWKNIDAALREWIHKFELMEGLVLEIGCGTGLLQDTTEHYIGIDIAENSSRFMHQPFCVASGSALPFSDNSFDGIFSVWVLEHMQEPEKMLNEMRRVARYGGVIFLSAAYGIESWVTEGLHKRPYKDLNLHLKLMKFIALFRTNAFYKILKYFPRRLAGMLEYLILQIERDHVSHHPIILQNVSLYHHKTELFLFVSYQQGF